MDEHAVPKLLGADIELGNFIEGTGHSREGSGHRAAGLLLREIEGVPSGSSPTVCVYRHTGSEREYRWEQDEGDDPQDCGRRFLAGNGGCAYIDLGHLEVCTPETGSARDHVAAHHANLVLAREACEAANAKLPEGQRIVVLANNSDGHGNSWGGHLSMLLSREAYSRIFGDVYPELLYLAAFQVSGIVYTGQGKVGAENDRPATPYQLTQRGDFFECLVGPQTTHYRPLVNARDEDLCGGWTGSRALARLHIIFFDTTLAHVATYLKAGATQIVVAMIEARAINPRLILERPLEALTLWGHDPELEARARLADGREVTAVEHQLLVLEDARRFVAAGGAAGVPDADAILALWEDTLARLAARDFDTLARRLDWVMKRRLLERFLARHPRLSWESPEVKRLDLLFASLDPAEGLYWALEEAGAIDRLVGAEHIERLRHEPPPDTRAWSRAMLLRVAGRAITTRVDWDEIRLGPAPGEAHSRTVRLHHPARFTEDQVAPLLAGDADLDAWVRALEQAGEGPAGARSGVAGETTPTVAGPIRLLPSPRHH